MVLAQPAAPASASTLDPRLAYPIVLAIRLLKTLRPGEFLQPDGPLGHIVKHVEAYLRAGVDLDLRPPCHTSTIPRRPRQSGLPLRRTVTLFVNHSSRALALAAMHGWLPGARYTNLRDVRRFDRLGFLDIDWKNYSFARHLAAAKSTSPLLTVAQDVEQRSDLSRIVDQAFELSLHCERVAIVPEDPSLAVDLDNLIPHAFMLGYSVPTRYGGTPIAPAHFRRPVHLLGGRPDVQRRLAKVMPVVSVDCNRFTIDAAYGDYFDGTAFRRHPTGGYEHCIVASIRNIGRLWADYAVGSAR